MLKKKIHLIFNIVSSISLGLGFFPYFFSKNVCVYQRLCMCVKAYVKVKVCVSVCVHVCVGSVAERTI